MNATTQTKPDAGNENPLAKFDAAMLKGIESTELTTTGGAFLPQTLGEAMEVAKLMASSNFVPPHLRGKAGDCLAVVMQSSRWGMDPFAVASKTYFVQERMAYEAQLVMAVLNSKAPLVGRLHFDYEGEGANLVCICTGFLRGDDRPKVVRQEFNTITTKNSPLWKTAPRQQLAYLTGRMWARLHCPEVLMGVYTEDELRDGGTLQQGTDGTYAPAPAKPQRSDFRQAEKAAAEVQDAEVVETETDTGPQAEDEGGDGNGDTSQEFAFELYNHWGERTLGTDDAGEFTIALGKLFAEASDEKVVTTLIENNGAGLGNLTGPMQRGIQETINEARTRIDIASASKAQAKGGNQQRMKV